MPKRFVLAKKQEPGGAAQHLLRCEAYQVDYKRNTIVQHPKTIFEANGEQSNHRSSLRCFRTLPLCL